ncbi:MAG: CDP-diacylglycerol--serine O-phosphatidyltransferase [Muribaculaceae bacterium]|nr:CDP-diacylglycerol--serine O-phosphatidyltransferase [Muribaculaceae bacterium]MBQ4008320.1 CDP-diacylglycerol--serine O-phosphatidyltransferase [Muribaculaceae bacterium]MBQ5466418.1 CDP-diacylglycerol--serine O-phosphatidyltransferase [Muribaculaceae bacterium]
MKILQSIKNNVPNAITCMNLMSGTLAVVAAFHCFESWWWGLQGYQVAFILIGAAALFDFLDGFAARLLHAVSPLGKELDSLCDLVSFGLAPAAILFNMMWQALNGSPVCYVALLLPIFGALRLAKFNISTDQTTTFSGLPIPANAIFWIGFTDFYAAQGNNIGQWVVVAFIVAFSLLMVCPLRMFSLKMHSLALNESWRQWLLVLGFISFVIIAGLPGLAWGILFYVALSACTKS